MKINLVSDLHLEFSNFVINNDNNADVLILGGDIMLAEKVNKLESEAGIRFRKFLEHVSNSFDHVIYIAGNHEFYGGYWVKSLDELRTACSQFSNVYFLERDTKIINDVVFVGGTLWTDMNKFDPLTLHAVRDMMMDYRSVRHDQHGYTSLRPADTCARHKETLEYIKLVVDQNKDKKCVVVGHHTPSFQSCAPEYANDHLMNGAYHSSLEEVILDRPQIKLWTHGHTHNCFDYMIGDTRIVCNPRGYEQTNGYSENTGWNPNLILEI
jgi:Icc-related predicted phosphoesterase